MNQDEITELKAWQKALRGEASSGQLPDKETQFAEAIRQHILDENQNQTKDCIDETWALLERRLKNESNGSKNKEVNLLERLWTSIKEPTFFAPAALAVICISLIVPKLLIPTGLNDPETTYLDKGGEVNSSENSTNDIQLSNTIILNKQKALRLYDDLKSISNTQGTSDHLTFQFELDGTQRTIGISAEVAKSEAMIKILNQYNEIPVFDIHIKQQIIISNE